jgi:hypothetical protein
VGHGRFGAPDHRVGVAHGVQQRPRVDAPHDRVDLRRTDPGRGGHSDLDRTAGQQPGTHRGHAGWPLEPRQPGPRAVEGPRDDGAVERHGGDHGQAHGSTPGTATRGKAGSTVRR